MSQENHASHNSIIFSCSTVTSWHACNLITWTKNGTVQQTNNSSVCSALLAELEISSTIDLSADRGREAVETEWVVLVWAMMLVHDDWSQAYLLTTHQMTNSVGERANAGLWCVRLSPGDAHPGCTFDTYCIGKVFISSQLWGHYANLTTQLRWWEFSPGIAIMFFFYKNWLDTSMPKARWHV